MIDPTSSVSARSQSDTTRIGDRRRFSSSTMAWVTSASMPRCGLVWKVVFLNTGMYTDRTDGSNGGAVVYPNSEKSPPLWQPAAHAPANRPAATASRAASRVP
jgi:hypothetical protein